MECTDSWLAVNRENWEGVVDGGEGYVRENELVVDDASEWYSVKGSGELAVHAKYVHAIFMQNAKYVHLLLATMTIL